MTEQTPSSEQWKRPSLPQWRREEAAGLWEPREGHGLLACLPRAWALPSEDVLLPGAGCGLRGNSGYQDACLQSGPASRPEQEQLVVIMLAASEEVAGCGSSAGPGCTLAARLQGTMEIESRGGRRRGGGAG